MGNRKSKVLKKKFCCTCTKSFGGVHPALATTIKPNVKETKK